MGAELEGLEAIVGYKFRNRELLLRALTHRSRLFEPDSQGNPPAKSDNEQLEFLGDAVLGLVVSDALLRAFPESREGELTTMRAHLVSEVYLYKAADRLGLAPYLALGTNADRSGGRLRPALLADAMEAIIAAVYVDGGIEEAREFVGRHLLTDFRSLKDETGSTMAHSKTTLQELAQKMKMPMPRYRVVREEGPQHARTFVVEARLGNDLATVAEGFTKKSAEQRAAQLMLEMIRTR